MKKRPGHIIILHKCTKNHYHMVYVPEIWCMMDVIAIFHFGLFFTLCLTRLKNENFKKIKKISGDIIFYTCVPKIMIRLCTEIWCMMDRQVEKVTYRGGCPT